MGTNSVYAARREKLRALFVKAGFDALMVHKPENRYYLSGFELHDVQPDESAGFLVLQKNGQDWLCTDSRYTEAAYGFWDTERVFIYTGNLPKATADFLKDKVAGKIGFEANVLTVEFFKALQGLNLEAADGMVEGLRVIKDADEIRRLERSMAVNHALMAYIPSLFEKGYNEAQLAWEIEKFFRDHGATENAFSPIVARDAHAALPHYVPYLAPVKVEGPCHVLVDVGARVDDYCSDQTRTFWVPGNTATPDSRFTQMLSLVQEAQQTSLDILRPGITGKEAWQAAHSFFEKHGVAQYFTHSLGHGVGLQTHEGPRLSPISDTVLRPGMVVSVEPGLYYPDWGGARWEYLALITEDGHRIL